MATQAELQLLNERQGVLGGSDIGALYNLDWGCRRKLGYEKSGVKPDFPEVFKPEFERGHYIEKIVAEVYADKTQRIVRIAPRKIHPVHSYMVVHMDREVEAPEKNGPGYLEIKVVNYRTMKKFKREGLHGSYILQMQHGLAVTGYQWGSYALLCLDPWEFKYFDIDRDEEIINTLMEDEPQFMSDIEHKVEFTRLDVKDRRCYTCPYRHSCQGDALQGLIPQDERDAELLERPDLLPLAAELNELNTMSHDIEAMIDEANKSMMEAIETAATTTETGDKVYPAGAKYPGGRSYRIQPAGSRKWDQKALWAMWDSPQATQRLKELLGKFCNNGEKGKPPKASLRHYWTGDK